jgi:hypothetical protein
MSGEAWLYLLGVLINAVNLFLQVFFTIMYSDLEWYVKLGRWAHSLFNSIDWNVRAMWMRKDCLYLMEYD